MKSAFGIAAMLLLLGVVARADDRADPPWPLDKGQLVDRVLLEVVSQYYDPDRFDPPRMLRAALQEMEHQVAPVQVTFLDDQDRFSVKAGTKEQTFQGLKPVGPWDVAQKLKEVFRFLSGALAPAEAKPRDLERAAVNGILGTLDPHSMVLQTEMVDELNIATSGEFGGLGIKITTDRRPPCNGDLTVVEVFEGTPAAEAGLKAGDRITRIGDESTVNITTSTAASRLRGPSGSRVTIWVERPGETTPRRYDLLREQIHVNSVNAKMLPGRVGYIKLEAFQRNSYADFRRSLLGLHQDGMKGLVIDLRGNPGGLLEIAVMIGDAFIDAGTIVTTAGRDPDKREVRNATSQGTEPDDYPIVVLVDSESASAAEILAAALQSHGRALVVGDTTFGKGSVQIVEQLPDGEDLKLTVAEYLTPGDFSIQARGVRPDVGFRLIGLDRKELRLTPRPAIHEEDLKEHLVRLDRKPFDHETILLDLIEPQEERRQDDEDVRRCIPTDPKRTPYGDRAALDFGRELIARTQAADREGLLVDAKAMVAERQKSQDRAFAEGARKLGVDWRSGPNPAAPLLHTTVAVTSGTPVRTGRTATLRVEVQNTGKEPLYRVRGVTESDNPLFQGIDVILGEIPAGQTRSWSTPVEVPLVAESREDPVKVKLFAAELPLPEPAETMVRVEGQPSPRFAILAQLVDTVGNGDGLLSPGEEATLFVTLSNLGPGRTYNTEMNIAGPSRVDVGLGRAAVGPLLAGETRTATFTFKLDKAYTDKQVKIELDLADWIPAKVMTARGYLTRQLVFPVAAQGPAVAPAAGSVTLVSEAILFPTPDPSRDPIGKAPEGTAFAVEASSGGYMKVILGPGRSAWVKSEFTKPGGVPKPRFEPALHAPPQGVLTSEPPDVSSADRIVLRGVVKDDRGIRDVYAVAGPKMKKVFYQSPGGMSAPTELPFEFEVPLEPGMNPIVVVARETEEIMGHEVVYIRRLEPKKPADEKSPSPSK